MIVCIKNVGDVKLIKRCSGNIFIGFTKVFLRFIQGWPPVEEILIAPCGMNCGLCISYISMKNDLNKQGFHKTYCAGCLPRGKNCTFMKQNCGLLAKGLVRFCYECDSFPCRRLDALDKRYRTKYHMSMIENLKKIRDQGMAEFLVAEEQKWRCPRCGGVISCHVGLCLICDVDVLKQKKTYRWNRE